MKLEKKLGKIESVEFGLGGYQGVMIGLHVTLSGKSWGVNDGDSYWDCETIKITEHTKWTEDERSETYSDIIRKISKLLKQAKVKNVNDLKGIPIEAEFEGMSLRGWRILEEVL